MKNNTGEDSHKAGDAGTEKLEDYLEKTVTNIETPAMTPLEFSLKSAGYPALEGDLNYETTFYSNPADKINIPEVRNVKATFVYNHFTKDERVRSDDLNPKNRIVSLDASNTSEIFNKVSSKKLARFVKLEFQPPQVDPSLIGRVQLDNVGTDLSNHLSKIVVEGGYSNKFFIGTELLDTGKESKIYQMLNGLLFFLNIPTEKNSPKEAAEKLYNTLTEKGGLRGQDKKLIVNHLASIASEGYNMAPTDVPPEISRFSSDPIAKQTFSVQFNQLLMSNVIANSTIVPDNVFQDEVRSLDSFARRIRAESITGLGANEYDEANYELRVAAIEEETIDPTDADLEQLERNLPDIKFAGYLIEKFEVLQDGRLTFTGRKYISSHDSTSALDDRVRYGGNYLYKIRTVARVKTLASREDINNPELNQLVVATCFMASEGIIASVMCVEKVPPPSVHILRATFDFDTLLPQLTWQFPFNKQRDIKRFQIFKRFSIDEPFTLLKEYDFDNSDIRTSVNEIAPRKNIIRMKRPQLSFIDNTHKEGEKPIYSIASVDAHAMSSGLGLQVKVERDRYTNKVTRTVISRPDAPKPYPNMFVNVDAFSDAIKVSNFDRVKIFCDPEYYRVTRKEEQTSTTQTGITATVEKDLNFLAIDRNNFRYSMHIINTDNQKDALVKIKLENKTSLAASDEDFFNVTVANFSENNINFQYGVE